MSDYGQMLGRANRLRDAAYQARAIRDMLEKHGAAGNSLTLRIEAHVGPIQRSYSDSDEFFTFGMSSHRDDGPGAPWQALPYYANRPFAARSCCGARTITTEAVAAALTRKRARVHPTLLQLVRREHLRAVVPLTVIIRDTQIAADYRQGLRCFVDVALDVLGRMLVMFLAALSHLAQAPSFLLVVLGAIRHYGRRGESDDHAPLITRMHPIRHKGVACLAT
jgi:hypothetical protein